MNIVHVICGFASENSSWNDLFKSPYNHEVYHCVGKIVLKMSYLLKV